jgi:hypothetical protein
MAGRHHYVAQFHLRGFINPAVDGSADPWLWVADCKTGTVKRRSPKNFGWSRGLFDGPGGLANREATLESFLAKEVEGPAAIALRTLTGKEAHRFAGIPPELGRYLAWAAARSLSMKALYESWIEAMPPLSEVEYAEPPPPGFGEWTEISRNYRMEHPVHGTKENVPPDQVEPLRNQGWRLCLRNDDFLGFVHLQAWYFQVRFFPHLKWLSLRAPQGHHFIIGDSQSYGASQTGPMKHRIGCGILTCNSPLHYRDHWHCSLTTPRMSVPRSSRQATSTKLLRLQLTIGLPARQRQ